MKRTTSKPFHYSQSKSYNVVVTQEHLFHTCSLFTVTVAYWLMIRLHVQVVVDHRFRLTGRLKHEIAAFPQWHKIDGRAVLLLHYR